MTWSVINRLSLVLTLIVSSLVSGFHSLGNSVRGQGRLFSAPGEEKWGIQILVIDEQHAILELTAPPFELRSDRADGMPCQVLYAPGYSSSKIPGWPDLPVTGALLGIPASAQPSLKVLDMDTMSLPGKYDLCPASQPVIQKAPTASLDYQRENT